jgi:hypothetical protein
MSEQHQTPTIADLQHQTPTVIDLYDFATGEYGVIQGPLAVRALKAAEEKAADLYRPAGAFYGPDRLFPNARRLYKFLAKHRGKIRTDRPRSRKTGRLCTNRLTIHVPDLLDCLPDRKPAAERTDQVTLPEADFLSMIEQAKRVSYQEGARDERERLKSGG